MNAPALRPYSSPDHREQRTRQAALALGGEPVVYGRSVAGRELLAVRMPGPPDAPRVLCTANIHGIEALGCELALALCEAAAGADAGLPELERLRARAELWVIPSLNPDGHARTWEREGHGTLTELRTNARGVDLNRNFPLPGGSRRRYLLASGSPTPGRPTYHGPAPLSEPESAALHELLRSLDFRASVNLHSFMGTLIPARVTEPRSYAAYAGLCRTFAAHQRTPGYVRLASRTLDLFTGELEDHQHHELDCWAICVEQFSLLASLRQHVRAPARFWRFNPRDPDPWIARDLAAVLAVLDAALELPRPLSLRRTDP